MLPVSHTESPQEAAQRQANFILLRSLETKIPSSLFQQVLDQLLISVCEGPIQENRKKILNDGLPLSYDQRANAIIGKPRNLLQCLKTLKTGKMESDQKINLKKLEIARYERMKTVFGHALINEGSCASIFNVQYDKTGRFVISGADDGIIKVWDKDTLSLQASLHGHRDVITDMDVSKCNKYFASASADGLVIVWSLEECKIIEKLKEHTGQVNNVKFFRYKIKEKSQPQKQEEYINLLVSCSDDGTVKIYDEQGFLFSQNQSQEEQINVRRSRNKEQSQSKKERFYLSLTPEDFRPGSRNKKIQSVNVNSWGIVAAGTTTGEIFLWKLDFSQFKTRQANKIYQWIGSFKKHQKEIHFCDFSPNGRFLFTGSIDGTAKIWNMEIQRANNKNQSGQKSSFQLTDDRLQATLEEKRLNIINQYFQKPNVQCDCLTWSCYGRYAIASISGKLDKDQSQELSIIKIWDSVTGQTIQDLAKNSNIQLLNFSFVLAPHPQIEDILLTGSSGGMICIWDLKQKSLIKKFLEYGVYSIERYTMNDPYDGKFSPDGSSFIVGSLLGTITIFSLDGLQHKYEQTRVEQFCTYDEQKHDDNVYESQESLPQVCGFHLLPYEVQPPPPIIGKFKNSWQQSHEEYERQLIIRREMCFEEEKFIKSVLEEGLQDDLFNPANNEIEFQQQDDDIEMEQSEDEVPLRRGRNRIDSDLSQIANNNPVQASQEDIEVLNRLNNAQRQRNNQSRGRRRNLQRYEEIIRVNPNFDPDNSLYDHESDENFEVEEEVASDQSESFDEEGGDESEEYKVKRENYHQAQFTRRQQRQLNLDEVYTASREDLARRQQNSRNERALRRSRRLGEDNQADDENNGTRQRSTRRRGLIESESEDYEMSDAEIKTKKRKLVKNSKIKSDLADLPSSDDESIASNSETEEFFLGKGKEKRETRNDVNKKQGIPTRNREKNRVRYDNMDQDSQEMEEEKVPTRSTRNQKRRTIKEESENEDFSNEDGVQMIDTTSKSKKLKGDEDYELLLLNDESRIQLEENMIEESRVCSFCKRSDNPLIGPFVKKNQNEEVIDGPHYFHQECIEVNIYSFYNRNKNKWMNIGKALEMLAQKKQYKCQRCLTKGATIKCNTCDKYYHGFNCSQVYMIWLGNRDYQCFECRNLDNYETFKQKPPNMPKQEVQEIQKSMSRDHLLQSSQSISQYIPQLNDVVFYFFQGHERFIREYNCYFYCGDSPQTDFDYPWKQYPELLQPSLCKIINISYAFPSQNALTLIKRFGKTSSDIEQKPQIVSVLELELIIDPQKRFTLDIFPNELPDFLVQKDVFERSFVKFEELLRQNKLIGQVFKTKCKDMLQIKIIDIKAKEPTLFANTHWETIIYQFQERYGLRERGRRGQRRPQDEQEDKPSQLMNFWELQYEETIEAEMNQLPCAFESNESQRLQNVILEYMDKKKEITNDFKERVSDKIAPDYRCHIASEMFLDLIVQRLQNNYYRTQEQLFSDLDLISYNSRLYNGEDSPLTKQAKKLVEHLRCELRKNINSVGQKKHQKEENKIFEYLKPTGKLTAPTRMEGLSTFDMFFKQQEEQKQESTKSNEIEEAKVNINSKQKCLQESTNYLDFKIQIDNEEYDLNKITPRIVNNQDSNGNQRRSTRNSSRINYNESSHDNIMNGTGEKLTRKREEAPQQQESLLGKRVTRYGGLKNLNSLNEGEDDEMFEEIMKQEEVSKNGRYSKRIRNQL